MRLSGELWPGRNMLIVEIRIRCRVEQSFEEELGKTGEIMPEVRQSS